MIMLERFTDRARKVMALANQEAQRFWHEYIGPEHVLLGLVKEGSGVASTVLKSNDIDLRKVRIEVEKLVKIGPERTSLDKLPQNIQCRNALEYAIEEARDIHHNYVGTEHLLLGLLREDNIASTVLTRLGIQLKPLRCDVLNLLGEDKEVKLVCEHTYDGYSGPDTSSLACPECWVEWLKKNPDTTIRAGVLADILTSALEYFKGSINEKSPD